MLPVTRRRLTAVAKIATATALMGGCLVGTGVVAVAAPVPAPPPVAAPAPAPAAAPAATPSGPPAATGKVNVTSTIAVTGTFDGGFKQFSGGGDGSQSESQKPIFKLAPGATIKNVLIGAPGGDGIHCTGSCTIDNVWWLDVGEDAATQKGTDPNQVMTIENGGAFEASDKVFQHNGPGTMVITNMLFQDIGKVYRSCGNCKTSFARTAQISNITIRGRAKAVAGVNVNFGDRAVLSGIHLDTKNKVTLCALFNGTTPGKEPTQIGSQPDGKTCTVR